MKKLLVMTPYLIINILAFYLLPMVAFNTGLAMVVLLIITPIICFLTSLLYGLKNGLHWLYAILTAILFTPTIFIFYNHTAIFYIYAYGIIAVIGNLIGGLIKNKRA